MPLIPIAALPPVVISRDFQDEFQWGSNPGWTTDLLYRDPTRLQFSRFRVGDIRYEASQTLRATYEPPISGRPGRFLVDGFAPEVIGRGPSLKDARLDWELTFDSCVQRFLATVDFEQSASDKKLASKLHHFFDLNELKYSQPLQIRAYGRLVGKQGHKYRVRWVDGSKSTLTRNKVPSSMVSFDIDQPFDAVVHRDARNWQLIKIESAFKANSLPHLTEQEADELFSAKKSNVPTRTLDWD